MALRLKLPAAVAAAAVSMYRSRMGDLSLKGGNKRRAQIGFKIVTAYGKKVGGDEDLATNASDLIADLMHLARWKELDWNDLERRAAAHFHAEVQEERTGHPTMVGALGRVPSCREALQSIIEWTDIESERIPWKQRELLIRNAARTVLESIR